jgi:predicted nucleotidyltransferase
VSVNETINELETLISDDIISKIDTFYVYNKDFDSVTKRLKGNIQAQNAFYIAKKRAKFIAKFPFVMAVGVSGSLSKGYYDNESDIDFFVITKPNKLWICRTLLMSYKKIFLLNSRKYFCINYFISSQQLEIEEKNRFTATELKTLIPMEGKEIFSAFYANNLWIKNYFSKFETNLDTISNTKKPFISKSIVLIKKITLKKWKSKFNLLNNEDFNIALKSTQNISKHHPSNFQKKVILALNSKIEEVKTNFNIILSKENV